MTNQHQGFTLIEIIVVIAIISILFVGVFVALNPTKRISDTTNSRRLSDIESITQAINLFQIDNQGELPTNINSTPKIIGTNSSGCDTTFTWLGEAYTTAESCLDLSTSLAKYLKSIPIDPEGGTSQNTLYAVVKPNNQPFSVMPVNYNQETVTTPTPSAPTPASSPLSASIEITDNWDTGYCTKITVTNSSANTISTWEIQINTQSSTIDNSWNVNLSSLSSSLHNFTPLSWNSTISANSSITDFGFCATKTGDPNTPLIVSVSGT